MTVSTNEKMQNFVTRCHVGVTWPTFAILDPSISETIESRNFNFIMELDDNLS